MQAFQEIAKVHVTENIFSQFMYKMLPTCNHLWTFKKSFCMQLALSGGWCFSKRQAKLETGEPEPPRSIRTA